MEGNTTTRLLRLIGNLAYSPADVPSYLRFLPLWGRSPTEVELPWMAFGAIRHLKRYLRPVHTVFEFGSGGSSLFFARRAARVLSVENDPAWHRKITDRAAALSLGHLRCEYHPIALDRPEIYSSQSYFLAMRPEPYDVIVVDGYLDYQNGRYGRLRHEAFARALSCVRRPGGIIVVDDFWMLRELASLAPEARLIEYISTGPCRYGVTSTAIFEF